MSLKTHKEFGLWTRGSVMAEVYPRPECGQLKSIKTQNQSAFVDRGVNTGT